MKLMKLYRPRTDVGVQSNNDLNSAAHSSQRRDVGDMGSKVASIALAMLMPLGASVSTARSTTTASIGTEYPNVEYQDTGIFGGNTTSISVNFSAVQQMLVKNERVEYLLTGYTNTGSWYQIGIYDLADALEAPTKPNGINSLSVVSELKMGVEFWNNAGTVVFPPGGGPALFEYVVNNEDKMDLSLTINSKTRIVTSVITDLTTDKKLVFSVHEAGVSYFVGGVRTPLGYFTGVTTETYQRNSNGMAEIPVNYKISGAKVVETEIDEAAPDGNPSLGGTSKTKLEGNLTKTSFNRIESSYSSPTNIFTTSSGNR